MQVVLAARSPVEREVLAPFEQLLGGGLLVEIEQTDPELALRLIQDLATSAGVQLSRSAVDALAGRRLTPLQLRTAVSRLQEDSRGGREITPGDVARALDEPPHAAPSDEFGSFLEDVSRVIAVAVENVPWRKKLGDAIRRWDYQGIRTDRLEQALHADSPGNVETLLDEFEGAAARLLEIRAEIGPDAGSQVLDDPGKLAEAERLLTSWRAARESAGPQAPAAAEVFRTVDPWFLNPDRLVLSAFDLEGRIPGDRR